jgi:hypothetical protein
MTIIGISICTTHNLMGEVQVVGSVEEAVTKFTSALEFEDGELIEQIVCNVAAEGPGMKAECRAFESEVEKQFYAAMPDKFIAGYTWSESKNAKVD